MGRTRTETQLWKKPLRAHCASMAGKNSPSLSGTGNSLTPQGMGRRRWVGVDKKFGVGTEIGCGRGEKGLRGTRVLGGTNVVASWPAKVCSMGRGAGLDGVLKGVRTGVGGAPPNCTGAQSGFQSPCRRAWAPLLLGRPLSHIQGWRFPQWWGWRDGGGGRW